MYTKKVFNVTDMVRWTRYETFLFFVIGTIAATFYYVFDLFWFKIPWTPLALVGTAVAFVIGFQNNSSYGRIWEARKIWGDIGNTSKTFGMFIQDMISNEYASVKLTQEELEHEIKTIIYRHIAWITSLRHAMRADRPWETILKEKVNKEWASKISPPEWEISLEEDLKPYLSQEDQNYLLDKENKQTALLYLQSNHLRKLKEQGTIWEFSFLELENILKTLINFQGKSERIKNFPYPRHFASLNHYFMWIFIIMLPFALVPQFAEIGKEIIAYHPFVGDIFVFLAIPFYMMVAWVFHTMEKIGRTGENPFEGSANDVPISTLARSIEIDLRQNLGESKKDIPNQFKMRYDTQM